MFRSFISQKAIRKKPYISGKPKVESYLKACPVRKVRRPGDPGPSCPGHRTGCPTAARGAAAAGRTAAGWRAGRTAAGLKEAAAAGFHMSPPHLLCTPE
jgi:hypothetical protein